MSSFAKNKSWIDFSLSLVKKILTKLKSVFSISAYCLIFERHYWL